MNRLNLKFGSSLPKKVGPAVPPKPHKNQIYGNNLYANEVLYDDDTNIYSNIPMYKNARCISKSSRSPPPPPPPLPPTPSPPHSNYPLKSSLTLNLTYANEHDDDYPPPPSPVSSSYSELRRATQSPLHECNLYSLGSNSSLACDSIYEPINPPCSLRTASSLSNYSNTIYESTNNDHTIDSLSTNKESEVDELADIMRNKLHPSSSEAGMVHSYDRCVVCQEDIIDSSTACTAMDQDYHIDCFSCAKCSTKLNGKSFYAYYGKPYCSDDYIDLLEKCSVCQKPILDRILRATGRPFHPQCFCCVVCGDGLDGITFTVDAANQVYCIEDFHKRFAPRCCVCNLPIIPQPEEKNVRVVALDRSFHFNCCKCEDCGLLLSSEGDSRNCYPMDGHVLCQDCNVERIQELSRQIVISTDL